MYPLVKIWQKSSLSEATAKQVRSQLKFYSHPYNEGFLWGVVGVGGLFFLIGLVVLIVGINRKKDGQYMPIQ